MALENNFNDFELLDDYLANRMSATEKASFEKQLEADPELKQEYAMQQKLVEGIKQARLVQLKGMLNNIPVAPLPTTQTLLTKLGTAAVVAGLIGTGIYFFFFKESAEVKTQTETTTPEVPPQQEPSAASPEPGNDSTSPVAEAAGDNEKVAPKVEDKKVKKAPLKKKSTQTEEVQSPEKPAAFDPSTEDSEENTEFLKALHGSAIRSMNTSGLIVDNIPDNKKYDFHYQFINGKLTLYGQKFRDSSMYEILEFFGNNKIPTTVVLYQNKKYYLLKDGNEEITRLTALTDPALLSKLDEYKKRK
jgi:hypothetical protein